ncbi:tetraspanin-8-like [Cryptomeria japonica]|uniref:tetraspanin-8-like n=1 Tax=Cryptomeria japonica TaxID=3369 RepID=UPI0027DA4AB8|nr:tetraspanin-8-like [Cryptomeria japonica]
MGITIIGLLTFSTSMLSVPILGAGIWLATEADNDCEKLLPWSAITFGAFLMLVSLTGLLGFFCRVSRLFCFYLAAMCALILLLSFFTAIAYAVTDDGGQAVSGKGYREYQLGDYCLQKRVENSSEWKSTKSSLQDAKVCKKLADDSVGKVAEQFYNQFSFSGCCKPPSSCNFVYVNATFWTSTASSLTDMECSRWSNEQDQLCYDCNSCKAAMLANLKHNWQKIAVIEVVVLIALLVPVIKDIVNPEFREIVEESQFSWSM